MAAAYARLHGWSLKAGEYEFPAGASLRQVLSMITEGKALIYRVTVSEGMTTTQILERIAASGALVEAAPENLPEGVSPARHLHLYPRHHPQRARPADAGGAAAAP